MVTLSGLSIRDEDNPEGDIDIVYTGLRPGEKLYEELLLGDIKHKTVHPRIFQSNEELLVWSELCAVLDQLFETLKGHDYKQTRALLLKYVNGFHSNSKVVDWLFSSSRKAPLAVVKE